MWQTLLLLVPALAVDCSVKKAFSENKQVTEFSSDSLPYPEDFLEPVLTQQMNYIHYHKHHQGYISKLNNFVGQNPNYQDRTLAELVQSGNEELSLSKFAGGHYNHNLYWWTMTNPECSEKPQGQLLEKIQQKWGSFNAMLDELQRVAAAVFGSGWAQLCVLESGDLEILSSKNQQNSLMGIQDTYAIPILNIDVWEHAYYLEYMSDRPGFIKEWTRIIDWNIVEIFYNDYASKKIPVPV